MKRNGVYLNMCLKIEKKKKKKKKKNYPDDESNNSIYLSMPYIYNYSLAVLSNV